VGLKAYFIPELFTGGFFPLSAAGLVAAADGLSLGWVAVVGVVWFGAEGVLARSAGWPRSASSVLAWIVRDLLIPVLWVSAWAGNSFVWRGNPMATKRKAASDLGRHQPSTIQ
jgi:ceramide glucosyltransferase